MAAVAPLPTNSTTSSGPARKERRMMPRDCSRSSVIRLLEEEGYHVYEAEHGRAALDLLAHCERPCVMLVDLMMPVMDGWALVSALRADNDLSKIPVVVVSALRDIEKPIGAQVFIRKPI